MYIPERIITTYFVIKVPAMKIDLYSNIKKGVFSFAIMQNCSLAASFVNTLIVSETAAYYILMKPN